MALLIPANRSPRFLFPDRDRAFSLQVLQGYVGGEIEALLLPNGQVMIINKEGKMLALPHNLTATAIARSCLHPNDYLVGTVVVATTEEASEITWLEEGNAHTAFHKPLVVVIDDSALIRTLLSHWLEPAMEVLTFPESVAALIWARSAQARSPVLLFLDLMLPKMDGLLALQHFKAHPIFERTHLVMMSRRDGTLDRLQARLAGAHTYLIKPFEHQEVLHLVYHVLSSSRSGALGTLVSSSSSHVTLLSQTEP